MGVEGLDDFEGRIFAEFDAACASCQENVIRRCIGWRMGEDSLVGLRCLSGKGSEGVVGHRDWNEGIVLYISQTRILPFGAGPAYLASDHNSATICAPCHGEAFASELQVGDTFLLNHIPEFDGSVTGNRDQIGFFHRIPGHALNGASMAAQFGTIFDLGLLGIPDAQSSIGRTGRNEAAGWAPRNCADAVGQINISVSRSQNVTNQLHTTTFTSK